MNIRFTLIAEGPTDVALLPILKRAVRCDSRVNQIDPRFATPNRLPPVRDGLAARIRGALEMFPADILFVHRDADRELAAGRRAEINRELAAAKCGREAVPVVPVRMTEAWLLIDEEAIRKAAENPRGRVPLDLPPIRSIEGLADPKERLYSILRAASELRGRRLSNFRPADAAALVADGIRNLTPLRHLTAFREFEGDLKDALDRLASHRA